MVHEVKGAAVGHAGVALLALDGLDGVGHAAGHDVHGPRAFVERHIALGVHIEGQADGFQAVEKVLGQCGRKRFAALLHELLRPGNARVGQHAGQAVGIHLAQVHVGFLCGRFELLVVVGNAKAVKQGFDRLVKNLPLLTGQGDDGVFAVHLHDGALLGLDDVARGADARAGQGRVGRVGAHEAHGRVGVALDLQVGDHFAVVGFAVAGGKNGERTGLNVAHGKKLSVTEGESARAGSSSAGAGKGTMGSVGEATK